MMGEVRDTRYRDWLMPSLLLCMREGYLDGHELLREMEDPGFGAVRPGDVYMTLRRAGGFDPLGDG